MKPIALRAKEGFGVLTGRSKSTPPIQREQVGKRPPSRPGVRPKTGDCNSNESTTLPIDVVNKNPIALHLDLPVPHPMNPTLVPSPDPQSSGGHPQAPVYDSTTPHLTPPIPPNPPPTSLEAYFLERKRRGVSGGGVSPRIITPTPGVKGKGFKSSPLSPNERDITDGVKRNMGTSSITRGDDGNSNPSEVIIEDKRLK